MSEDYRVQLDVFSGPLDLLLYLIRRDEVDVHDIPVARIAGQYLDYVRVIEQLDPNAAGEFLVLAATLVELKSRALLPAPPIEIESEDDDPRSGLVRQLLEYKRFKDAAEKLGSARDDRERRFVRRPGRLPAELEGVEMEEVELWDLVKAFRGVMEAIGKGPRTHDVVMDETPLAVYASRVIEAIEAEGALAFHALFLHDSSRAEIIGMFLAVLELLRGQRLRAEQAPEGGEIYLFLLDELSAAPLTPEELAALEEADAGYSVSQATARAADRPNADPIDAMNSDDFTDSDDSIDPRDSRTQAVHEPDPEPNRERP